MGMADLRGIALPFRITPGDADIATVSGDRKREMHIETILGTRASSAGEIGELAWDPDRGSALDSLRNAAASEAVGDFAALYVENALAYALPDESLRSIDGTVSKTTIEFTIETSLATDRTGKLLPVTTLLKR